MDSDSNSENFNISKDKFQKKKKSIKLTKPNLKRLNTYSEKSRNPYTYISTEKNNSHQDFKLIKDRNNDRKKTYLMNLFNYNKSANKIKSTKKQSQSNLIQTLSTYDNEKEIMNRNNDQEKIKNIHKKIFNMYNAYYKTYINKTSKNKKKEETKILLNSPPTLLSKKDKLNYNIHSRSIETRSKTSQIKSSLKKKLNIQTPKIYPLERKYSIQNTSPDKYLHEKVSQLVEEIDHKKKKEYKPRTKLKEGRTKLLSLLNKKKGNFKDYINLISRKKITKNDYPILIKKPTNNIEMNNLIINSFSTGYNYIDFSKKLYNLNEVFFNLIEAMKQKRSEIDIAKFERAKKKYSDNDSYKNNRTSNFNEYFYQRNNRDKWEKKFMLDQYEFKIPESEFQKFKKYKKQTRKKNIVESSKKLSNLITNLDAEEYENPDEITLNYKSTRSFISSQNFKRISRLLKILKTNEDEEQTGNIILKADVLRKEQKNIENEMNTRIGKSGKARFVKNIFKPKTIDKYKSISGNYFGLPV